MAIVNNRYLIILILLAAHPVVKQLLNVEFTNLFTTVQTIRKKLLEGETILARNRDKMLALHIFKF